MPILTTTQLPCHGALTHAQPSFYSEIALMFHRLRCFLLLFFAVPAFAGVHMPTGEYRESVTDLEVKVLGGLVAIERTWQADDLNKGQYRWHPNPAWDDL
ncbi:MAG: hypothetical protein KDI75_07130, partial [Xanthomonadales bacterium]|nr:hypothetical protein [Xanthomonadales bacterium]